MKILLLLITLTLALMKEEKKPGYIKFVSLGTTRECTDYAFKFNIIAGSVDKIYQLKFQYSIMYLYNSILIFIN